MTTATTVREKIGAVNKADSKLVVAHMYVVIIALAIGGTAGLIQVLERSGYFEMPSWLNYYQVLTLHGVVLALVLTTFFIMGFQFAAISRVCGGLTNTERKMGWIGFAMYSVATITAAVMILLNEATVLYTFYAPLQAHVIFYIALAVLVVGTWISATAQLMGYFRWKRANKGQKSPLLSYMVAINNVMWYICTIGVATSVLGLFIPWSLGLVETINVSLSRTLFWYFGHALVYFWLLPAYMVWYAVLPKVIGTLGFSDNLARMSFMLFLFFSIPVGIHHQLTEPGIDAFWKSVQVVLTFMVIIPSLMTAFSMFAVFETYGRQKGAKGLLDWFKKLPWKDSRFVLPFIGMLFFIPGGIGGIINASGQMNQMVHNTIWIVGHFHITVGTPVVLTYFGAMMFLLPHITGRQLTPALNKMGLFFAYTWALGMTIMSAAMHFIGLTGAPRRSSFSEYGGHPIAETWQVYQIIQAVGGTFLFIGIVIGVILFIRLMISEKTGIVEEFPVATFMDEHAPVTRFVENWKFLVLVTVFLVLVAYTVPIYQMLTEITVGARGFKLW